MTFVTPGIDAAGRVIITSRGTTYKVKHIRRDPRVSMLIFGEQYSGSKFVQIHGTAEIIDLPRSDGHADLLVQDKCAASTKTGTTTRNRWPTKSACMIRVNIEKVGPQSVKRI